MATDGQPGLVAVCPDLNSGALDVIFIQDLGLLYYAGMYSYVWL